MPRSIAVVAVSVLAALAALLPGDAEAVAARADFDFRGKWNLELRTPVGDITGRVSLQPNGKGRIWLAPGRPLPIVHQYAPEWISWTLELPADQSPDGNAHTIIGRGSLRQENVMFSGEVVIVTAVQDLASPVGYETHTGSFAASREPRGTRR
ncbi:MAG TPA: hypothetical protein VFS92_00805 [Planctomycetota bacterium]|nr:hypothetical protein [Planctomycetota bacterium]